MITVNIGQCKDPGIPMDGSVVGNHNKEETFEFGAVVRYTCDAGFFLIGSPSIQCVVGSSPEESVWNASTPFCQGRLYFFFF